MAPACHPERRHWARGLCAACYQRERRLAGQLPSRAAYLRAWRAAHPEATRRHHEAHVEAMRAWRRAHPAPPAEPLPELFPEARSGSAVSWWTEELALELRQEAEMARLEGRDPEEAVRAYRSRELAWYFGAGRHLLEELVDEQGHARRRK